MILPGTDHNLYTEKGATYYLIFTPLATVVPSQRRASCSTHGLHVRLHQVERSATPTNAPLRVGLRPGFGIGEGTRTPRQHLAAR